MEEKLSGGPKIKTLLLVNEAPSNSLSENNARIQANIIFALSDGLEYFDAFPEVGKMGETS